MSHATQLHNRRYFDDYLEIINRHGLPGNVKHEVCQQVRGAVLTTVQTVIEHALREEVATYLGCARYAHLPCGRTPESTLSGSYSRALMTQYGGIPALRVPKLRRGNGALTWQTITRYERCWGPLLDQHILGYCLGLSLRDLQEVIQVTLGEGMSLAACNRLVWTVQEQVKAFKTTVLDAPPPIVLVDGMWIKIAYPTGEITDDARGRHRQAKRQQKRVVLTALGVWPDGHWEIVHWQIAPGETAATWKAFFGELYRKGITEQTTALVVSDGSRDSRALWIIISMGSRTNAVSSIRSSSLQITWSFMILCWRPPRLRTKRNERPSGTAKKPSWRMPVGSMTAMGRPTSVHGLRCSVAPGTPRNPRPWPTFASILIRPSLTARSISPGHACL